MNKSQRRARLKRVKEHNDQMRGRGVTNIDGAPKDVADKVRKHILAKHAVGENPALTEESIVGTEAQRAITHSPSGLDHPFTAHWFAVQPTKRSKFHAVLDEGTVALCGKDVGEWDPTTAEDFLSIAAIDACAHCWNKGAPRG